MTTQTRYGMSRSSGALGVLAAMTLSLAACGGGAASGAGSGVATGAGGTAIKTAGGRTVNVQAHNHWLAGVKAFKAAQKSGWSDAKCDAVAEHFEDAAGSQEKFAEAHYMAGVAHLKCKRKQKAMGYFAKALRQNSKFCKARVMQGLDRLEAGSDAAAEREFSQAVRDDPQCTEGYVNLAILQRQRPGGNKEALANLRRALAIDAQYLPAFNEMALLYVSEAHDNMKMLDLAEVVCSQAQKIDANYAPVYNTWGLIDLRRNEIIDAAAKFQKAFQLDPEMFEAYMNFAQITIGFRGYEDARVAFEKALKQDPKNFDAIVGLGVAYRGLGQTKKAEELYNQARSMSGNRPEPYYNLGVLYQDFLDGTEADMKKARSYYEQFLTRAGGDKRYEAAVDDIKRRCKYDKKGKRRKSSKCLAGRFQNIEMYLDAMKEMAEMEKLQADAAKQQAELEKMEAQQRAEDERRQAEEAKKAAEEAKKKEAEEAKKAAEEKKPAADEGKKKGKEAPNEGSPAPKDKKAKKK